MSRNAGSLRISSGFFGCLLRSSLGNDIDASVSICRYASLTSSIAHGLFYLKMLASTKVGSSSVPCLEFLNQLKNRCYLIF